MKKFSYVAFVALVSAATLASCSKKEDEPQANAPQVATDITISLPSQATGGARRMPGKTVQTDNGVNDFQGIGNIYLVPFAKSAKVQATDTRLGANIGLGDIAATTELGAVSKAKLYKDKNVPMGTSAFLFYGESLAKDATSSNLFTTGKLTGDRDANTPAGFTFSLSQIQPEATEVTGNAAYVGLLGFLNYIANVTDGTKAWKNYSLAPGSTDNEGYAEMWATYKTAKNLNSFGIERMMNDLYHSLALNTTDQLAANLTAKIVDGTYATLESDKVTLKTELKGFPASVNLPEGSIAVIYDETSEAFIASAEKNFVDKATAGNMNVAPITSYVYPSSLWYYANTRINTSTQSEDNNYNETNDWATILGEYDKENGSVNTRTRSVALIDKVQYGVARLDVKIKAAETLEDNASDPKTITNTTGYELMGVLVGGQKNVGFDFTPETYNGAAGTYTIYDSVMTTTIKTATEFGAANSTLVLETEAGDDKDVFVAVELLNNSGKDFYGADGLIPAGGKFYLVGKLTSANSTVKDANNNPIKRVFIQDYTTTARFTIENLKKAYNMIPDLKTPALEIGLSVDMTWESGTTYDITL